MGREDLEIMKKVYDLGNEIGIKEYEIDNLIEEVKNDEEYNRYDWDVSPEGLLKVLKNAKLVVEELKNKNENPECKINYVFNSYYGPTYSDEVYVKVELLNSHMNVFKNSLEAVSEEDEDSWGMNEYKEGCEFLIRLNNDENEEE